MVVPFAKSQGACGAGLRDATGDGVTTWTTRAWECVVTGSVAREMGRDGKTSSAREEFPKRKGKEEVSTPAYSRHAAVFHRALRRSDLTRTERERTRWTDRTGSLVRVSS